MSDSCNQCTPPTRCIKLWKQPQRRGAAVFDAEDSNSLSWIEWMRNADVVCRAATDIFALQLLLSSQTTHCAADPAIASVAATSTSRVDDAPTLCAWVAR